MTPVPAPRGGEAGQEQTTVLGILVETTRRIEDTVARGFENVNTQLARLPEVYVARREFDRYRDELALDWQEAQQKHNADIAELKTGLSEAKQEIKDNETRRVSRGRYVITTLIALGMFVIALLALVLAHR